MTATAKPELALYRVRFGTMTHYATGVDAFDAVHTVVGHLQEEGHYAREEPLDLGKATSDRVGTVTEDVLAWSSV